LPSGGNERARPGGGDLLDEGATHDIEAEPVEQLEIAFAPTPEAECLPGGNGLGTDAAEHSLGELVRRESRQPLVEAEQEDVFNSRLLEQLEPPLDRGEKLDLTA